MPKNTPSPALPRMTWPGDAPDEIARRHELELAHAAREEKRRIAEAAAAAPQPEAKE